MNAAPDSDPTAKALAFTNRFLKLDGAETSCKKLATNLDDTGHVGELLDSIVTLVKHIKDAEEATLFKRVNGISWGHLSGDLLRRHIKDAEEARKIKRRNDISEDRKSDLLRPQQERKTSRLLAFLRHLVVLAEESSKQGDPYYEEYLSLLAKGVFNPLIEGIGALTEDDDVSNPTVGSSSLVPPPSYKESQKSAVSHRQYTIGPRASIPYSSSVPPQSSYGGSFALSNLPRREESAFGSEPPSTPPPSYQSSLWHYGGGG